MIVQRNYVRLKADKTEEAIAITKEGAKLFPRSGSVRNYTSYLGPQANMLVWEVEFENLAELEQSWAAWLQMEEVPALLARWYELVQEDVKSEVWFLHA